MKKILLIFSIMIFVLSFSGCGILAADEDKTTNISDYSKYFGQDGKHNDDIFPNSIPNSDIFPDNIPSTSKIEDFCYYYYNLLDPNYVSYLVYSCNDEDYKKETERLSKLNSSKDYLIYSTTGFKYPICAVYADEYGYVYALTDKENKKMIYVEIKFCNYFSDIDYENIIDKKYLPIDFNAKSGNPTRQAFDKGKR